MVLQRGSNGFAMRIECLGNTHRMVLQHGSNGLATHKPLSRDTGLSPQDGDLRISVAMCTCTRVGHNLCNPDGLVLSFMSTYEL